MIKRIFSIVFEIIDLIGVKKTLNLIIKFRKEYLYTENLQNYLTNEICTHYKITRTEFITGISRKNKTRFIARSVYVYVVFEVLGSSDKLSISNYLQCSTSSINDNLKFMRNLDNKIDYENDINQFVEKLKTDISNNFIKLEK